MKRNEKTKITLKEKWAEGIRRFTAVFRSPAAKKETEPEVPEQPLDTPEEKSVAAAAKRTPEEPQGRTAPEIPEAERSEAEQSRDDAGPRKTETTDRRGPRLVTRIYGGDQEWHDKLRKDAAKCGMSISTYVRLLIDSRRLVIDTKPVAQFAQLVRDVREKAKPCVAALAKTDSNKARSACDALEALSAAVSESTGPAKEA